MARILLVEDDEIIRVTLYDRLKGKGFDIDQVANGTEALKKIEANIYNLVISDIKMPGLDGIRLMGEIRGLSPDTDIILMTAYGGVDDAVDCLRKGAADYILKPFDMDDLTIRVNRILSMQKIRTKCLTLEESSRPSLIIGSSPIMERLQQLLHRVAGSDSTVLITGESGTGKELAAAAIHFQSSRAKGPYIKVNCGAIPENLIESELFGHEKGSFTGALSRKSGRFEVADGGTLLLDEIGDLPLNMQVKLLRVLQEKEFERVGGTKPIKIDVRIICATAKNLAEAVKIGQFREDLFYRLQVIPINIPPLRERMEDVPALCNHFLKEFSVMRGMRLQLSDGALKCLSGYRFPGNIRELRNIIERASVLTQSPLIDLLELPGDLTGGNPQDDGVEVMPLAEAVRRAEKSCILNALRKCAGNKTKAAEVLGISRKNLWEKMKAQHLEI
ncbi:MAG: sigma-54 dependent transcriptional regulator [Proteobacteria bacterium]|nr:sigma-54 dependent transcriptional regulator [Pseudomonadota bacterium]MBU1739542.1 sigma-54 dependent transcriptional regulator [Pseudomonadota bacterium]